MNTLRVLSAAAALALILPLATPSVSFAQVNAPGGGGRGAVGGGGAVNAPGGGGGGGGMGGGGGVFRGGGAINAPSAFHGGGVVNSPGAFRGGVAVNAPGGFRGSGVAPSFYGGSRSFATNAPGNWSGGWRHHRRHGGFWPGFAAGALIGSVGSYGYYSDPYYYDDYYYYDSEPTVADAVDYCRRRFRSYDPASGTYLGYDGLRHRCP